MTDIMFDENIRIEKAVHATDIPNQDVGQVEDPQKNFSVFSMLSLSVSLMATWEAFCSTMVTGLSSGGPVSLVYGFIVAMFGSLATAASLGEMASMFPTSGGQYHFVAALAPRRSRLVLSWISGWTSTFGWQALAASSPYLGGTLIESLVQFNNDTYISERWHGTMMYWAIILIATLVNVFGNKALPLIQNLTLIFHVVAFIIVFVVVCVVSPTKHMAAFVFTESINNSGWSNKGVAWCIGMLSSCYVLIGYDGATHMCEEIHNPRRNVPYAMVGSIVINGIMGLGFVIAILFNMGDVQAALAARTTYPIIEIFYNITQNRAATTAMCCSMVVMASLATIPLIASSSRMLWSLARDKAFPFSHTLSVVDPKRQVPTNAILATAFFLIDLGFVNIGSTTAFNAIVSIAVLGLELSYLLPIILMLWCRLTAFTDLPPVVWSLGKWGVPVNLLSIIFLTFTSIFLLFPPYQPVTAANMNYASLIFGGVCIFSVVYWFISGHGIYQGPVIERSIARAQSS